MHRTATTDVWLGREPAHAVHPMPFWQSLLVFGIPGLLIYMLVHFAIPPLHSAGVPLILTWTTAVVGPTVGTALVVLILYFRQPGTTWRTFVARFRFTPLQRRDWLLIPVAVLLILVLNFLLAPTIPVLQRIPLFAPAPVVPELFTNAYEEVASSGANVTFMGVPLEPQNWWLIPYWTIWGVAALAEEIVWRGYALPRQELTHGRWAWVVNGLLWNIPFHAYVAFNLFSDMPMYFIVPFLAQWRKSTWLSLIIHLLMLSLAYAIIIPGVLRG